MSKKFVSARPKRTINRRIRTINTEGPDLLVLRAVGDSVTLVRTIIQGSVASDAALAIHRKIHVEIWRRVTTSVLPAHEVLNDLTYAESKDLLWAGVYPVGLGSEGGNLLPVNVDMKGNRKLDRREELIIRFEGDIGIIFRANVTTFYKEV